MADKKTFVINPAQRAFLEVIADGKAHPYKEAGHHRVRDVLAQNGLITKSDNGLVKITASGKKALKA